MVSSAMKASILTIGDELLIGQVLNSNAQWMSERLTELGCEVVRHLTVGDLESEITEAVNSLLTVSDTVIIGGGLGPTHDDLTLEALSNAFDLPLVMDSEWLSIVQALFKARNRVMTENNKKQALLLSGAKRIDNDCGTAAGQHFQCQGKEIFVVPGVPFEMKSMMERTILPELSKKLLGDGVRIKKETLLTTGIGESALAERLSPVVKKIQALPGVTLAFLPSLTTVRLRLQMKIRNASDEDGFDRLVSEIRTACGKDYFGAEPLTLESWIIHELKSKGLSLALAESCTGGLISHRLTQVPGASSALMGSIVAYQENIKSLELGISEDELRTHGVVSETTARSMAESIRKKWNADFGLATTGYLGPEGGDLHAPLGTVWIALSTRTEVLCREFKYEANRERSKERAAQSALDLLRRQL